MIAISGPLFGARAAKWQICHFAWSGSVLGRPGGSVRVRAGGGRRAASVGARCARWCAGSRMDSRRLPAVACDGPRSCVAVSDASLTVFHGVRVGTAWKAATSTRHRYGVRLDIGCVRDALSS